MSSRPSFPAEDRTLDRIAALEDRIARLEARLELKPDTPPLGEALPVVASTFASDPVEKSRGTEDLEFRLGQNWFALAGVLALTFGAGYLVSLPHARLPAGVPSLFGYAVVGVLFFLARAWRSSFEAAASYLRGAAMVLLAVSTLRLVLPPGSAWLDAGGVPGRGLLILVVIFNVGLALRRRSPWLLGVALVTGAAIVTVVGTADFIVPGVVILAAIAVFASRRGPWPWIGIAAIPLGALTYLNWALGNPLAGNAVAFVSTPRFAPAALLVMAAIFGRAFFTRETGNEEQDLRPKIAMFLNCAANYGVFLIHTFVAFRANFVAWHLAASVVFLGLATAAWTREASRVGTFFQAMTGYAALSFVILKGTAMPDVFVWLSGQSLLVVATAIWFRSRFIVVGNFCIYLLVVVGYVIAAGRETGISLGIGAVALLSARLLNWQKHRLELKTDLMRNAYLISGFVVLPYALAHLVPAKLVAFSWVALALGYYAAGFVVHNAKYRWMGHGTLLLTLGYVSIVSVRGLDPAYRILSFLALGAVLLIVSLAFTRARRRRGPIDAAGIQS